MKISVEKIKDLRPTQFCFGPLGFDYKLKLIDYLHKNNQAQEYLDKKPVPVILFGQEIYLIDRHHLCRSLLLQQNIVSNLFVTLEPIDTPTFSTKKDLFDYLEANKLALLEKRGEKISFEQLPDNLENLSEDWHRGLAWILTKSEAIVKSPKPFVEFYWANYLRSLLPEQKIDEKLLLKAITLSLDLNPQTKNLPGFQQKPKDPQEYLQKAKTLLLLQAYDIIDE